MKRNAREEKNKEKTLRQGREIRKKETALREDKGKDFSKEGAGVWNDG